MVDARRGKEEGLGANSVPSELETSSSSTSSEVVDGDRERRGEEGEERAMDWERVRWKVGGWRKSGRACGWGGENVPGERWEGERREEREE